MTQEEDTIRKMQELNDIFLGLNENGKENVLIVLKALSFAQTTICQGGCRQPEESSSISKSEE